MAYVAGSAVVEIVPSFAKGQLAIDAFFAKQGNEVRVNVRPDVDERGVRDAGDRIGRKLGDSISEGMNRSGATSGIDKEIEKLSTRIDQAGNLQAEAAKKVEIAETRLREAREKGTATESRLLQLELAAEQARARQSNLVQAQAQAEDALREARRRSADLQVKQQQDAETKALAEIEKAHAAALKEDARYELARTNLGEAMAQARERSVQQAHAEALRENARYDREINTAHAAALRENARMDREANSEVSRALKEVERDVARSYAERMKIAKAAADVEIKERQRVAKDIAQLTRDALKDAQADSKVKVRVDTDSAATEASRWSGFFFPALQREVHQRSLFIASVAAGVFAAAGPVLSAASVGLFAGLGAAAVSSSETVRSAWVGTWQDIKSGAQSDAQVLVPVYAGMATKIGSAFQDVRPLLKQTFADIAPQVSGLTDSIIRASENALPGLARAASTAGPSIKGLGTLMEDVGTGVGKVFTTISQHQGDFGAVFSNLGDSVEQLLPALGNLAVAGAKTANNVLPALNAAFSTLNGAISLTGGALPSVLTGFLAFRSVANVGDGIRNIGTRFTEASAKGGQFAETQGKIGSSLSKVGSALPIVGAAFAGLAAGMARAADESAQAGVALDKGFATIRAGGDAGRAAAEQIGKLREAFKDGGVGADEFHQAEQRNEEYLASLSRTQEAQLIATARQNDYNSAVKTHGYNSREAADALGEFEAAERDVADAAADEERAITGVTQAMADQVNAAAGRVNAAFDYQTALTKVQDTLGKLNIAQGDYNDTVAQFGPDSDEARSALVDLQDAQAKYNQALNTQVQAKYNEAVAALPAAMDPAQKSILGAKAALDELNGLLAFGVQLPPEMEAYRQELIRITGEADGAALEQAQLAAAFTELGFAVDAVPGQRSIRIDTEGVDVPGLTQQMEDLGFSVRNVDGQLVITANTDEAMNNLGALATLLAPYINGLNLPPVVPQVDPAPAQAAADDVIEKLHEFENLRPAPVVMAIEVSGNVPEQVNQVKASLAQLPPNTSITVSALDDQAVNALATLGFSVRELPDGDFEVTAATDQAQHALDAVRDNANDVHNFVGGPTITADTKPFDASAMHVMGSAYTMDQLMAVPTADLNITPFTGVEAGLKQRIVFLDQQRPKPVADLDANPFNGKVGTALTAVGHLNVQKPTPTADMNDSPFNGKIAGALGAAGNLARQKPTPTGDLNLGPFQGQIAVATGRLIALGLMRATPVVSIIDNASGPLAVIQGRLLGLQNRTVTVTTVQANVVKQAAGGLMHAFANGGFEPMAAGLAQIVPPNTWRVIGDRAIDDEAYIPINASSRSAALLAETARRMGYQLAAMADGGRVSVDDGIRRMVALGENTGAADRGATSIAGVQVNGNLTIADDPERFYRQAEISKRRTLAEIGL